VLPALVLCLSLRLARVLCLSLCLEFCLLLGLLSDALPGVLLRAGRSVELGAMCLGVLGVVLVVLSVLLLVVLFGADYHVGLDSRLDASLVSTAPAAQIPENPQG